MAAVPRSNARNSQGIHGIPTEVAGVFDRKVFMTGRSLIVGMLITATCASNGGPFAACGQERPARTSSPLALLQASDLRDRTWGAYLVSEQRAVDLLVELSAFLPPPPSNTFIGDESEAFYHAVLDSLIRLGADLPVEALTGVVHRYPDEGVILFAQASTEKRRVLLDVFQQQMPLVRWQAIGNLLAGEKAPGFAGRLLAQMQEINVTIEVSDSGVAGGEAGDDLYGISRRFVPEGYPPIAYYQLTNQQTPGAILVAPGPHPIYYERTVVEPGHEMLLDSPGVQWNSHFGDRRDPMRLEYLAMMLGVPADKVRFDTKPLRTIQWSGQEHYARTLEGVCTLVLGKFDSLKALLTARGLITSSEAAAIHARVHLKIFDFRQDKRIPLPETNLSRVLREP